MILRRITEHVKAQNWLAVALDFFIVVVGILIAFQITNWSESRQDRERERQIIVRLHTDFQLLGNGVDERIEFLESISDGINEFEQLIIDYPENVGLGRIQNFFETSFTLPNTVGHSDTYEQLVASGDMNLLTSDTLRAELVSHASLTNGFIHQDRAVREWSRPYFTSLVRLRSLIETMPLDEAVSEAGSKADLIIAADMYQNIFAGQLSIQKEHRVSFAKLTETLAQEIEK